MKRILLALALASQSFAADLSLRVASIQMTATNTVVTIGVSGTDSNHVYSLLSTDLLTTNRQPVSMNFIGTNGEALLQDASSDPARFYIAQREPGFIVWADVDGTPTGGNPNDCPGPSIGRAIYTKPIPVYGWFQQTNNPPFIARDATGRTDSRIQYFTEYGETGCDEGGKITMPLFSSLGFPPPAARFSIYWRTNIPSGPYPLHLIGFDE